MKFGAVGFFYGKEMKLMGIFYVLHNHFGGVEFFITRAAAGKDRGRKKQENSAENRCQ